MSGDDYIDRTVMSNHTPKLLPGRWIRLSDLNWWMIFGAYALIALLSASTVYTAEQAEGGVRTFLHPLIWEITGHLTAFLLLPFIVTAHSRLPVQISNAVWTIPIHVALSMVLGIVHTVAMYATRLRIYDWLDLGLYDYGYLDYRLLMEYHKQALHYWAVYLALRIVYHYRQTREHEKQKAALELRTSELQRQLAQSQLATLRGQLQPHFLFNTLNMIASLMHEDVDKADRMLVQLSALLRASLEASQKQVSTVGQELAFLEQYLDIMRTRFEGRLNTDVRAPEDVRYCECPPFLLQPLVENSIRHNTAAESLFVGVAVHRDGDRLRIVISDNGPGMSESSSGSGVGLSNTRERLRQLYGSEQALRFRNRAEGGLEVVVELPYRLTEELQPA